jgi:hypothetical protein
MVHLAGEVAGARGAVERPAPDGAAGGAHTAIPRLAARDQRERLKRRGRQEDEQRRRVQRLPELVTATGQDDEERAGDRDAASDPDRRAQPR